MSKVTTVIAAAAIFALAGLSHATTVDYTVSDLGPALYPGPVVPPSDASHVLDGLGYPGDSVEFDSYAGTLDLTPGTYVQKIGTLSWNISYTYAGTATDPTAWSDLSFNVDAGRNISFGTGAAGSLRQMGLLEVTWENDFLSVNTGSTSIFFVPGYQIDVTPLSVAQTGGSNFDGDPAWMQPDQDIMARFEVTAVSSPIPEPLTIGLVSMGIAGLGGYIRRRAAGTRISRERKM
jgi:hypothetical protein